MSFDSQNYIELFYQDAEEHLELMTEALLDLEKNSANRSALDGLFRSAHTMKSSSAMVGFMHVSEFTHRMEDLIGHLRDSNAELTVETVNLLFKSFDVLKEMLSQLQDEETEATRNTTKRRAEELIGVFHAIVSGGAPEKSPKIAAKSDSPRIRMDEDARIKIDELRLAGDKLFEITIVFAPNVQMAATRAFLIASNLSKIGTVVKTEPDLMNEQEEFGRSFAILFSTKSDGKAIVQAAQVSEVERCDIREVTQAEQFEWPHEEPSKEIAPAGGESIKEEKKDVATSFDRREDPSKLQTVRVNIEKLDRLLNLAAEMVIQRGRAQELGQQLIYKNGKGGIEEELLNTILHQGMFLTQLQETIMDTRMVPIGTVFSRYRRVVRDLSHNRGKKVNLVIEGEETELDKKIIDQIGDPLMHMVRNSVDHGIESPEERRAKGKSPEGLLHLNAYHVGNCIIISVKDDGQGLDPEKLKAKAVEKGTITPEEAAAMSQRECLNLVFRAGFSTAKEVTDISGRGVGMDVVRRSIDQLGGTIDIETEVGKGATFYIKLPLTLAIIQALLVESQNEMYAIPISHISETIRITRKEIYTVKGQGKVIRLRNSVVPILNLKNVMEMEIVEEEPDRFYVAVLKHGDTYAGLIVDRMVNEEEIVIKSLGGDITHAPYVAGAAILGNGRVILILDAVSLIETTLVGSAA
ncbi:MAG: chemotaxis protein CheA [Candidatus Omnitrophota bacterium]